MTVRRWAGKALLVGGVVLGLSACGGGSGGGMAESQEHDRVILSTLTTLALTAEAEADYRAALSHYVALAGERPNDPEPLAAVARMHRYLGNAGMAREVAESGLQTLGEQKALRLELAKARLAEGDRRGAEATLAPLLTSAAEDWEVQSINALLLDRKGELAAARTAHEAAVRLSDHHPQAVNNLALNMAMTGDLDQAIALLQEAVLRPRPPLHMHQNLALMLALSGAIGEAEAIVRRTLPLALQDQMIAWLRDVAGRSTVAALPLSSTPMPEALTNTPEARTVEQGPLLQPVPVAPVSRQ